MVSFAPDRVVAKQPQYRPGVSATRELRIEGKRLRDVLTFESTNPERLGFTLHLQGRIIPVEGTESVEAPLPYWESTRRIALRDRAVLRTDFDGRKVRVIIETEGRFTLTLGRSPDMPPDKRDSIYVEKSGSQATFRTTFEPE